MKLAILWFYVQYIYVFSEQQIENNDSKWAELIGNIYIIFLRIAIIYRNTQMSNIDIDRSNRFSIENEFFYNPWLRKFPILSQPITN